jgi:hypothetical protein
MTLSEAVQNLIVFVSEKRSIGHYSPHFKSMIVGGSRLCSYFHFTAADIFSLSL